MFFSYEISNKLISKSVMNYRDKFFVYCSDTRFMLGVIVTGTLCWTATVNWPNECRECFKSLILVCKWKDKCLCVSTFGFQIDPVFMNSY